ncbi:hypothetical protein [Bradyrhizobium sp. URHD0069]|uniref:hypothetical protein n=1 Tax=Bradyrhizobium sp. URHD0069 TaxID=1380355 RepID=UPI000B1ABAF8|nr:hypothetical protein [Bradyrhizobium sp. URHD0069]
MVVKVSARDIAGYALSGRAAKVESGWRKRNGLDKQLRPIKRRRRRRRVRKDPDR